MRKSIAIIITSILVLSGCNKQQSVSDRLLNEVEKAIAINPDSASNLLKGISSPEKARQQNLCTLVYVIRKDYRRNF